MELVLDGKTLIFIDEELKEFDENLSMFDMSKFNKFINSIDLISGFIVDVFEYDNEYLNSKLILEYIKIKVLYSSSDILVDEFKDLIINFLKLPEMMEIINLFIENNYEHTESCKDSSKINKQLVFNEDHCREVQKMSYAIKLIIPLVCDYHNRYNLINDITKPVFSEVIRLYNTHNTINKIYKLAESRVKQTQYSDRVIWEYLANIGKAPQAVTLELYYMLITSALHKLDITKYPLHLLHVILKSQLTYTFRENIKIEYLPLKINGDDTDGITALDKLEEVYIRLDEGKVILSNINKDYEIKRFVQTHSDIQVTDDELKYYMENLNINKIQTHVIFLFLTKYIGEYSLYHLNKEQYFFLVIFVSKYFRVNNLDVLADFLLSNVEITTRKNISSRVFLDKLENEHIYKEIYSKYSFIKSKMLDRDPILSLLSTLNFNHWYLISYEDNQSKKLEYGINEIAVDLLYFIYTT